MLLHIISYLLIYLYGLLMGISAILITKKEQFPIWATVINLISVFILFMVPFNSSCLYLGLILLLISALMNGSILNGRPNPKHVVVRVIISIIILGVYLLAF